MRVFQTHDFYWIGRIVIFLSLCCVLFASSACGHSNDQSTDPESKVTVLYNGDETIFFQDNNGMEASYLMFLPLVSRERDQYGEVQPVLAEHWEHSEDHRIWTFRLRKNVKWHDGFPVTAHDIKFTMDLRQHPDLTGGRGDLYVVEVLDSYHWTVTYKEPTDGPDTWEVFYPKHLLKDLDPEDFYSWDFWKEPVGNGPYRYVRHIPKTMIEVEANPDYYKGKPRIERVVLKFSKEPSLAELMSGNVDALTYVGRDALSKIEQDGDYRAYHWWGRTFEAIYWNHGHPLLEKSEIRRALTMAINRQELAEFLMYPEGVPIIDVITTRREFRKGHYPKSITYSPEKATQIFNAEDWHDTDGNGILDRNGEEFKIYASVNTEQERIAIYVQDQLRRIGVRLELQVLDVSLIRERLRSGQFEALFFHFDNTIDQPNYGHRRMLGEDSPFGYFNAEMIRLLDLAQVTFDLDRRDKIYNQIAPIFTKDLPITLLFPLVQTHIVNRRIQGLSSPHRADPVSNMQDLWIKEEDI